MLKRYGGADDYPLLSARHIDELGLIHDTEAFRGSGVPGEVLTREGDVIMKIAAPNPAVYIPPAWEGAVVSSFYFIIRVKEGEPFDPRFLTAYFNSRPFRAVVERTLVCSTVKSLKISDLKEMEIPALPPERQEQIVAAAQAMRKETQQFNRLREKREQYYQSVLTRLMGEGSENG